MTCDVCGDSGVIYRWVEGTGYGYGCPEEYEEDVCPECGRVDPEWFGEPQRKEIYEDSA